VAAGLELQRAVDAFALDAQHQLLVAAEVGRALAHHLAAPAALLAVAGVHARQIGREQGGFLAARARADLEEGVAWVVRVLGQQRLLQLAMQAGDVGLGAGNLLARHLGQFRVVQHATGGGQVGLALGGLAVQAHQRGGLGLFPGDGAVALHVLAERRVGEVGIELGQAHGEAVELLAQAGLHGEGSWRVWAAGLRRRRRTRRVRS
jgi:hypothetical protein